MLYLKKGFYLLLCACVLLTTFTGCGKKSGQAIQYNLAQEPVTLDPQIAGDPYAKTVIMALYEGLTRLDENNRAAPGVAMRWESDADFTSFTFYLRTDALWSDETPVTAHDFVYAFTRAVDPKTASTMNTPMFAVKNAKSIVQGTMPASELGVTAVNDHTLKIDLEYAYENFPAVTALPVFMPCNQTFFEASSGKYGLDAKHILGNGPFKMTNRYSWEHGQYINLTAASTYRGENPVQPATLTFSIGTLSAEEQKQLSAFAVQNAAEVEPLKQQGYSILSFEDTTWGLCFNTEQELMKESYVRRAFVQTLDREAITAYLPQGCSIADDLITPGMTLMGKNYRSLAGGGFYLKQDASAVQKAYAALKAAGKEKMPSVTVLCLDDPDIKKMVNEMLAAWNSAFGNYFNMEPLSRTELENRVNNGNYTVALCPIRPTDSNPTGLLSLFESNSRNNPANLKSSVYDRALADAVGKPLEQEVSFYAQAEQYLNTEGIFYPIYYEKRNYAVAPGLTGITVLAYDMGIDFLGAKKA